MKKCVAAGFVTVLFEAVSVSLYWLRAFGRFGRKACSLGASASSDSTPLLFFVSTCDRIYLQRIKFDAA
jgi:hypothetical protein